MKIRILIAKLIIKFVTFSKWIEKNTFGKMVLLFKGNNIRFVFHDKETGEALDKVGIIVNGGDYFKFNNEVVPGDTFNITGSDRYLIFSVPKDLPEHFTISEWFNKVAEGWIAVESETGGVKLMKLLATKEG